MKSMLYSEVCSFANLELAYRNARKGKTQKPYVIEFEKNLKNNLLQLQNELRFHIYKPQPLQSFILRDPKTRTINRSTFRDRIVHHAICIIIAPIFEKNFIYDSYANRVGKGVLKAIKRFETFSRKVSKNHTQFAFVFKADIRQYFDTVSHTLLLSVIKKTILDQRLLWLIKQILSNFNREERKGMPLGNLTSQFFANVYLNELDHYVKHILRANYYIRYVDDWVLFHHTKSMLENYKKLTGAFLRKKLQLELHPDKSRIVPLHRGIDFLGLKIFPYHKLLKKKNLRKFRAKLQILCQQYDKGIVDYDTIYDFIEGWCAYTKNADTYKLRKNIFKLVDESFAGEISTKEINRYLKILEEIL